MESLITHWLMLSSLYVTCRNLHSLSVCHLHTKETWQVCTDLGEFHLAKCPFKLQYDWITDVSLLSEAFLQQETQVPPAAFKGAQARVKGHRPGKAISIDLQGVFIQKLLWYTVHQPMATLCGDTVPVMIYNYSMQVVVGVTWASQHPPLLPPRKVRICLQWWWWVWYAL